MRTRGEGGGSAGVDRLLLPSGVALVLLVAVVATSMQRIDVEEVCRRFGECVTPATAAVLRVLLGVQAVGVLAVLAGIVADARTRPAGLAEGRPLTGALLAGVVGTGLVTVAALPLWMAAAVGWWHLVLAGALLTLLAEARTVTAMVDTRGTRSPAAVWAGLVAVIAAAAVAVAVTLRPPFGSDGAGIGVVVLLHGAVVSGVVLVALGGPRRAAAAMVVVATAVTATVLVLPDPARPTAVAAPAAPPVRPQGAVRTPPTPIPTVGPVAADRPCAPTELSITLGAFDAATGVRAAIVIARNTGAGPCWLDGVPEIAIARGGRPLRLAVEPGQVRGSDPVVVERVGLAPGGSASVLLSWRPHGGWADQETPQSLSVVPVPGGPPFDVPLGGGAPIDVVDDAEFRVTGWAGPAA